MHTPRGIARGASRRLSKPVVAVVITALCGVCALGYEDPISITGWISPALGESSLPREVRVTLRDLDSVYSREVLLSGGPRFEFTGVPRGGRYRITVEAAGRTKASVDVEPGAGTAVSVQLGAKEVQREPNRPGTVDVQDLWRASPAGKLVRQASEDIAKERFDSALRRAEKAVAISPGASEAHATKAFALLKLGKVGPAEESLLEAVRLDSENVPAIRLLGWLYLGTKRPAEAVEPLSRAAALDPHDNQGQVWLAEALYRVGRYGEAVAPLRTVLASDPGFARASYQLGYAYLRLNRHRDALETFRRFLETNRDIDPSGVRRIIAKLETLPPEAETKGSAPQ